MNDVDRENLTERIQIVEALLVVAENPVKLLEVCAAVSGDHTSAVKAVADAFQFTDLQASVVLDMQIRRFTPEQVQLLRDELSDFRERLAEQLSKGEAIAGLVRVEGIWTGNAIAQAIVENVDSAVVVSWSPGGGEATPAEIGSEKFCRDLKHARTRRCCALPQHRRHR